MGKKDKEQRYCIRCGHIEGEDTCGCYGVPWGGTDGLILKYHTYIKRVN